MANDQIRQAVAILLFFLSIKFILEKRPIKFLGIIVCASFFHYSAILMAPFYFILRMRPKRKLLIFTLFASFFIGINGLFLEFIFSIISYIPRYGEIYTLKDRFISEINGMNLGLLFKNLCALTAAIYYKKSIYKVYILGFVLGTVLTNLSFSFMPLERLSYYLLYLNFIVFPLLIKENKNSVFLKTFTIIVLFFFSLVSLFGLEKHGAVPYRTFFGENLNYYHNNYIND
jgi:hypothetical protein